MAGIPRSGLTLLSPTSDDSGHNQEPPIANVIFVHGLRGHPRGTWEYTSSTESKSSNSDESKHIKKSFWRRLHSSSSKNKSKIYAEVATSSAVPPQNLSNHSSSVFWPAEFLPTIVPQANIFTYGYIIEGLFLSNNRNSIIQHANDMMIKLERGLKNDLPIVFIAHSLGGIIVKAAMQRCKTNLEARYTKLLLRVYAIIFCGTPHRGSDAAAWGKLAANIVTVALQSANDGLLGDLQVDSQILDLIQEDFLRILHGDLIRVHSFQESRGLAGIKGFSGKVVNDFSSRLGYGLETTETIDANHMDMVRMAGFREISEVVKGYIDDIQERSELESTTSADEPYIYLDRFYMLDYKSFLFRVPKRHQNTCSWVIDNPSFLEWRDGKTSNAFWLHGYPGLGKSVVAKFVLETLSEYASSGQFTGSSKPLVCYFFCSDTDDRAKCPRNLVASIIYQLLYEDPQLAKGLKKKYTTITDEFTRSVWELWNVLGLVLADLRSRPLYIVIDALDELEKPSWRTFLEELRDTITPSMRNIRLFITSRTEPDIEKIVSSWNAVNLTINDSSGNRSGLSIFLRDVVHDYAAENSFDKEITRTICEELVTRADGMFLWASLAWEHFKDGVGSWKITVLRQKLEELQQLPPGMENLYFRLLSTVDKRVQWELIHILHWLVAARRPLSIAEISVALALKEEPEKVQDMDVRVSLRAFLKRTCPHMIRIDQAGMLTVVHQSFKDFLLQVRYINQKEPNPFHINIIQANRQLGRDCMVYVGLEELAQDKEEIWVFLDNTNVRHPNPAFLEKYIFLDYASLFWSSHIKGVDDDLPFYRNFLRVVGNKKSYQALCFSRHIHSAEDLPLFTAGKADLFGLMRRLVEDGHDINALNRESSIVHLWGCDLTTSRLRVLLELGADMNAVNSLGYTFLTNLSRLGRANDLREILKYPEFDVNAGGSQRMTPLHAAVIHKPQKAQELLDALMTRPELDFDSEDSSGRTPLTFAIHWGKEAIAKTLLKNPKVDIAKARMQGESPLINATCQCWTEIVLSILNRLDNIDGFCDSSGRTILHWTIIVGMDDALKLALTKDCSILEASDNRGMTALHYSAHEGQYHATELLISQGARPRGRTTFGETVLHLAAARGHERILRLLLKNTEDPSIINEKDLMGWTVAHRAIISGNEDLVKYLVALEIVDWTKVDRHGRTPLAFAAAFAPLSILQIVLGARKQANGICFIDAFGNTLLHLAASGNNESTLPFILERLLDKGNQPNKWGKTVLDLIPLTSPARETLVKAGLRHSKQFSERVATSLSKKEVREESPDRSDWQLQVLPPDYESEENYGDNQPDIQLSETPQWIEPVIT